MEWPIVLATIVGPIAAVGITLWYQRRIMKWDAKQRLFITLMAHRKSNPPTFEWVNALNLIDVVYADHPKVVALWHDMYAILSTQPVNMQAQSHKYLEVLSAMAGVLGYRSLSVTDIDKFYSPQAHGTQAALNAEVQTELLRVLKATASLQTVPKSVAPWPANG